MKRAKKFLINTVILTGASLLMRTIGMGFSVYLSNKVGPEGIGLFELIMSVYTLAVSLAAAGIRLSTTRLVVDARSHGSHSDREIMTLCIRYSMVLGTLAGVALYSASDLIAGAWLDAPSTAVSMRILAFGLPFLSVSSCLNGYFSAIRQAYHNAGTQMLEQGIKIAITIGALRIFLPLGSEYACVAMVIGSCSAEVISTVISYMSFRRRAGRPGRKRPVSPILGKLLSIAVPDAVGSWVRSSLVTAKNLLIPAGLRKTGASASSALATYGTIQGMVMPILGFPSALLGSLSSLLIPEVAESRALGHTNHIKYVVNRAIHITLLFSIAVAGILFCFAGPLGEALYPGKGTSQFIRILAPIIPVMYLDMMVDGVLKGLGLQMSSMRYNIIDAAMSLTLVWLLIPQYGIWGYIITIYASELLNFYLSISKLIGVAGVKVRFWDSIIKPVLAIGASGMCANACLGMTRGLGTGWSIAASITACLGYYFVMAVLVKSITMADLRWFTRIIRGS